MKLVSRKQMQLIDQQASNIYHIPSLLLMEHAANAIFLKMKETISITKKIIVVCAHGNNGGDGFALARLLFIDGYQVSLSFRGDRDKLSKDALINYQICLSLNIPFHNEYTKSDVIVDCLFGTGLNRKIEAYYQEVIETINKANKYIISIDIPSGIDSDSGEVLGCAIQSNITYTFECGKVGLYVYPGRMNANKVAVLSIHLPKQLIEECSSSTYLINKEEMIKLLPKRSMHSNKGSYGKVLCIGGSENMSGAISLAAKSALSAGCGLLTCAIPRCIKEVVQTNVLESMSMLLNDKEGHIVASCIPDLLTQIDSFTCALIGCGIGRDKDIKEIMKEILKKDIPLIIDADGLYAFKDCMFDRKNTILTPHLKEFAYLLDIKVEEVIQHTLKYVEIFTTKYPNITLVLKSETTIISHGKIRYINTYGNNGLAVGGSGDVLAGMIAGLYAQNKNTLDASILGVFLHAYEGDNIVFKKSEYSLLPSVIIDNMEKTLHRLRKGEKE